MSEAGEGATTPVTGVADGPQFDSIGTSRTVDIVEESVPPPEQRTGFLRPALWYAAHGFKIMPLAVGSNKPDTAILGSGYAKTEGVSGKPFVGSNDLATVARWWTTSPASNIGLITGVVNNLLVIDCDGAQGVEAFAQWCRSNGVDLSNVPYSDTPGRGGGRHWFFRVAERIRSRDWMAGVEVKAEGFHVAAAPSMRIISQPDNDPKSPKGSVTTVYDQYRACRSILNRPDVPDAVLAGYRDAPTRYPGQGDSTSQTILSELDNYMRDGFPMGARDNTCLALARSLMNRTGDYHTVWTIVRAIWAQTPQPPGDPFPWAQAEKCIRQAHDYRRADLAAMPNWRG